MGKKVTISFTLSEDLAKELDECAKSMGLNRSMFMEWLLSKSLPLVPAMSRLMEDVFKAGLTVQKEKTDKKGGGSIGI